MVHLQRQQQHLLLLLLPQLLPVPQCLDCENAADQPCS
jgi:hypothetical protein